MHHVNTSLNEAEVASQNSFVYEELYLWLRQRCFPFTYNTRQLGTEKWNVLLWLAHRLVGSHVSGRSLDHPQKPKM